MMPSKRAAATHAARAHNDGLCKGKLTMSIKGLHRLSRWLTASGRMTGNPEAIPPEKSASGKLEPEQTLFGRHRLRRVHAGLGQAHRELQPGDTLSVRVGRI